MQDPIPKTKEEIEDILHALPEEKKKELEIASLEDVKTFLNQLLQALGKGLNVTSVEGIKDIILKKVPAALNNKEFNTNSLNDIENMLKGFNLPGAQEEELKMLIKKFARFKEKVF